MSPVRRGAAVLAVVAATLLALATPAAAHPLGNSSTNLSSELRVGAERIVVDHVVDLAEIRTLQLLPSVDLDGDDEVSPQEAAAYAETACAALPADLSLSAAGEPLSLAPSASSFTLAAGQGGLSTARLTCRLSAAHELSGATEIAYQDDSFDGRFGWREVTAVYDRTTAERADVPAVSPSDRLTTYPDDGASGPIPDVRTASLLVRPGGPALVSDDVSDPLGRGPGVLPGVDRLTTAFTDLVGRTDLTLGVALLSLLVALVLGAGHALAPGHGKTVMAAYLVGQEGTRRQALQLGGVVTLTHTLGVLLLGLLLLASSTLASERVVAGLEVASGVLLAVVGGYLLRRALLRRRFARRSLEGHEHGGGVQEGQVGTHDHDHGAHDQPVPGRGPHDHGRHEHGPHAPHDHDRLPHDHDHDDHRPHDHDHDDHRPHDHDHLPHAPHDHSHDRDHGHHDHAHHDHAHHDHAPHDHAPHDHAPHDHAPLGDDVDRLVPAGHDHRPDDELDRALQVGRDDHGRRAPGQPHPLSVPAGDVLVQTAPPQAAVRAERTVVVDHDHGLGRHTHVLPDPARPLGARSLAAMGVAGGLVPSPSALVVLLGANAIGRTWWGVVLVVAYGVGMALTLTLAGLALLRVRNMVVAAPEGSRRSRLTLPTGVTTLLPVLTAGVIILVGAALVLRGLVLSASFG